MSEHEHEQSLRVLPFYIIQPALSQQLGNIRSDLRCNVMSVRSSDPCPRLTSVLLPSSLACPTQRQAEASTDKTSGGWGLMLCLGVQVSVFV